MMMQSERMAGKKPNPVDTHVGSRVRLRRMLLGMSQERLGDSMGLTFQQVQKYEKGVNRIGASRLFQISKILDVPVQFFFEEAPHIGDGSPARGLASGSMVARTGRIPGRPVFLFSNRGCSSVASKLPLHQ